MNAETERLKLVTRRQFFRDCGTGLGTLAQTIQSELTATGQHFSSLENKYDFGEVNNAMADEPACKPFVSSSG